MKEYTVIVIGQDQGETLKSIRPRKGESERRFSETAARLKPGQIAELRILERAPYSDPLSPDTWAGKGTPIARQEFLPSGDNYRIGD